MLVTKALITHKISNLRTCTFQAMRSANEFYDKRLTTGLSSDTIFALSSGPMTKTGVAVIRLSGGEAKSALNALQNVPNRDGAKKVNSPPFPEPRRACVRTLYDPKTGDMLDKALVLWMPGPNSFTGEDIVELHTHGSRAVIQGVFSALEYLDTHSSLYLSCKENGGIRAAERGEFTRRAFDNGRMDLTEVEGLSDLLEAETGLQRIQALRQMEGHLSATFEKWRGDIIKSLAHTEAVIDFGDDDREEDVDDSNMYVLIPKVRDLRDEIERHLKDGRKGELVREGLRVALAGPPNAGKSSLMNALAKRPAAIVSPIAGTTRDIVEVRMDLGGVTCFVSDTAGLREDTDDPIEREGIRRAREAFQKAHLKLFVGDSSDVNSIYQAERMLKDLMEQPIDTNTGSKLEEEEHKVEPGLDDEMVAQRVLMILNKSDLSGGVSSTHTADRFSSIGVPTLHLSCTTGHGLADLEASIEGYVKDLVSTRFEEGALITRERHRRHLQRCATHLDNFLEGILPMDAAAEELRLASLELGRVTGRVDVEELLDVIFKDFCIGK